VLGGEVLPHAAADRQGTEEHALDAAAEEAEAEVEVEVEVEAEALQIEAAADDAEAPEVAVDSEIQAAVEGGDGNGKH
jgi:hypothetical protein